MRLQPRSAHLGQADLACALNERHAASSPLASSWDPDPCESGGAPLLCRMEAGCPVPSQIGAVRAQGDALRPCRSRSEVQMLSTPLTICPSAEAMQRMPQRDKGPIETKRENSINKLLNLILIKQVVVKLLPGQHVIDRVDRGRTPRPI